MEMIDMLESVFDEEEAQRIHLETLVREKTAALERQISDQNRQLSDQNRQISDQNRQLSDQNRQISDLKEELAARVEADRLKDIVWTNMIRGADDTAIVQHLVERKI